MTDDYFTRHPIRVASAWPSVEIALLNGDLPQGQAIPPEVSQGLRPEGLRPEGLRPNHVPDPTTPTPENGDHAQEEKSREDREG